MAKKRELHIEIAERLAYILDSKNISCEELAKAINVAPAKISRVINNYAGTEEIQLSFLCDVCNYVGCTLDWLVGRVS